MFLRSKFTSLIGSKDSMPTEHETFWSGEVGPDFFPDRPHSCKGSMVLLCISGEAEIETNIKDNKVLTGTEMIILPGIKFYVLSASSDFRVRVFTFSRILFDEIMLKMDPCFPLHLSRQCTYQHIQNSLYHKNSHTFMDMARLIGCEEKTNLKTQLQRNFIQSYLLYLFDKCRHYFEPPLGKFSRKKRLFYQFLTLLDTHYQTNRDVSFYAKKLFITPRYLSKITNECSSYKSPKKIIDKRIILEIKVLLQTTEMNLQEIADILHFPDQSYFGRYFKHHTRFSASEYRDKINA